MNSIILIGSIGRDIEYIGTEVKKTEIADILNYNNLQNLITINTSKVGA